MHIHYNEIVYIAHNDECDEQSTYIRSLVCLHCFPVFRMRMYTHLELLCSVQGSPFLLYFWFRCVDALDNIDIAVSVALAIPPQLMMMMIQAVLRSKRANS